MMNSEPTLHEFVLNLLNNPQALSAFQADPEAVLGHAGLGDISAADVHEVIPLVLDYAPVPGAEGLEAALSQLPIGSLENGPAGAIEHLQMVAHTISAQLPNPEVHLVGDYGVPELGIASETGITGSLHSGYAVFGSGTSPLGSFTAGGIVNGLDSFNDVTDRLDAPLSGATSALTGALPVGGSLPVVGALPGVGALANPTEALTGLAGHLPTGALPVGELSHLPAVGEVPSTVTHVVGEVTHGDLSAVTSHLPGDLTSHLPVHLPTDDLTHTLHSTVGQVTSAVTHGPVGDLVSHSPVGDVLGQTGLGNVVSGVEHAANVTDLLHGGAHAGAEGDGHLLF